MIRILIIDDHELVRSGLRHILENEADFQVVGQAADFGGALQFVRHHPADVVLLDLSIGGRSGLELLRPINELACPPAVLVLTIHAGKHYAVRAFQAGASGYITKDAPTMELIAAVKKVAAGGIYVSASLAELLAQDLQRSPRSLTHQRLSNRELEVFRRIAEGQALKNIARDLLVSAKTVSTYKARVMEKIGVVSDAALVRYAVEHRLFDLE